MFDAAAKYNGVSLNSCLSKGPDINQPLLKVLMNFRIGKIAISGDIKEMFPQIKIIPEDKNSQRFLWRHGDRSKPVEQYKMTSMIFGANCSPSSAQFVKNLNAKKYATSYSEASKCIMENHYFDDYVASFHNIEDAKRITKNVILIHKAAHFELRKFVSNSKDLLDAIKTNDSQINESSSQKFCTEKILGLYWDFDLDVFKFKIKFERFPIDILLDKTVPTKRQILQIVMSIFDPFGFLNNFTVLGRLLIQDLWTFNLEWDQEIPRSVYENWLKWKKALKQIDNIEIPRCFSTNLLNAKKIEVHIFTDASDKIYSSVAYLRICYEKSIDVSFIMSKSRVINKKKTAIYSKNGT